MSYAVLQLNDNFAFPQSERRTFPLHNSNPVSSSGITDCEGGNI